MGYVLCSKLKNNVILKFFFFKSVQNHFYFIFMMDFRFDFVSVFCFFLTYWSYFCPFLWLFLSPFFCINKKNTLPNSPYQPQLSLPAPTQVNLYIFTSFSLLLLISLPEFDGTLFGKWPSDITLNTKEENVIHKRYS